MGTFRGWGGSALITGASGGIGHALAHRLAARGMNLILVARSGDRLRTLAEELHAAHGVTALPVACDLATVSTEAELAERLGDLGPLGGNVDLLVNNAAFGIYGAFPARGGDREAEMLRLNLVVPVLLTARILPSMRERGRGVILQVASTAAFAPVPYQGSYAATKAHLVSWTHALDTELAGSGVRACVLCPGSTRTGFHAVSGSAEERERKLHQQSADDVARECLAGLDRGRRVIVTGTHNRIYAAIARVLPPAWAARAVAVAMKPKDGGPGTG